MTGVWYGMVWYGLVSVAGFRQSGLFSSEVGKGQYCTIGSRGRFSCLLLSPICFLVEFPLWPFLQIDVLVLARTG